MIYHIVQRYIIVNIWGFKEALAWQKMHFAATSALFSDKMHTTQKTKNNPYEINPQPIGAFRTMFDYF